MAQKKTDTAILAARLDVLGDAVTKGRAGINREFYMSIPARPGHDADLVLAESARRLRELEDHVERLVKFAAVQGIELRDLEPGGSPDMSYDQWRSLPDDWDDQAYLRLADEVEYWKHQASEANEAVDRIREQLSPMHMGEPVLPAKTAVPDEAMRAAKRWKEAETNYSIHIRHSDVAAMARALLAAAPQPREGSDHG